MKSDFPLAHYLECRLSQRLHLDKPLVREIRLNDRVAPIAAADVVNMFLGLDEKTLIFQVLDDLLSCLEPVHPFILFWDGFIEPPRFIHDVLLFEVVPLPHEGIPRIMGRRHFDHPRAKSRVDEIIGDDRYTPPDDWKNGESSDELLVSIVVRMHRDGSIAEHGFRSGGGYDGKILGSVNLISDMPQLSVHLRMLHFVLT